MEILPRDGRALVLVVDDDSSARLLARAILEQGGFAVQEAENGVQALEVFQQALPDVVLLDVLMPVLDGFSVCARLRRTPEGEHTPVLIVTGLDDVASVQHAYEVGATYFVTKPINWLILRETVRYMLRASRAFRALQDSEAGLAQAQRIAQLGNWEWEIQRDAVHCSAETYRILGVSAADFRPGWSGLLQAFGPAAREAVRWGVEEALQSCQPLRLDDLLVGPAGMERQAELQAVVICDPAGNPLRVSGTLQDVSERKGMEKALHASEERYALAARGANDGLWDWDLRTGRVYFSPRWKAMLGYGEEDIGDRPEEWLQRLHPDDRERVRAELDAHLAGSSSHFQSEYRMQHRDGTYRWLLCRGLAVREQAGEAVRIAGSQTDVTERRQAEEQLQYDAFHDALTGLPNRALFMDRLGHAAEFARRHAAYGFAVMFMDLDRFKVVNDSLGHVLGDQLLVEVSGRIKECLRSNDTLARIGGDEFTVLFEDVKDLAAVTRVVERIQRELSRPFRLGGHEIVTSASIGITLSTGGENEPEAMLRDADTAMYRAKASGKARYEIFDPEMHAHAVALLQLETELRAAVERSEFRLLYQPIVSLRGAAVRGFEALLRWQHPKRGLLLPRDFLGVAEETGLIVPIGHWVLKEACAAMRTWQHQVPEAGDVVVSVNLSSPEFAHPELLARVDAVLQETGLDPQRLEIEITETVLIENTQAAADVLAGLRQRGIRLSLDDFGTGYSSLSYLHRFAFDTVKIDQSFVARLGLERDSSEIVRAIVTLAHNLDMSVVAEGEETPEQVELLKSLRCELGQGFLFSQPVDRDAACKLISTGTVGPGHPRKPRQHRHHALG
jgi:diguanylate cyclase (GGDEF)-like protein/PAS domain S-box-containing protein